MVVLVLDNWILPVEFFLSFHALGVIDIILPVLEESQ